MLFYAITVRDGVITCKHESSAPIVDSMFINTAFESQDVISLPGDVAIQTGLNIGEYTADWELKPMAQRVAEGYVMLAVDEVIDGEVIRAMTLQERIAAGYEEEAPQEDTSQLMRIEELKDTLAETDYRIIKCYEYALIGLPIPYDVDELHVTRQAARDEINILMEVN